MQPNRLLSKYLCICFLQLAVTFDLLQYFHSHSLNHGSNANLLKLLPTKVHQISQLTVEPRGGEKEKYYILAYKIYIGISV